LRTVQRLFSSFPDGRPGAGLLILRMAVAYGIAENVIGIAVAPLLLLGFMTPAGAIIAAAIAFFYGSPFIATIAIALALLGPGAFSIDAKLFGRREIVID
jgi:uncharacterized membrane protein YphA (DoxX/SURF4 family)